MKKPVAFWGSVLMAVLVASLTGCNTENAGTASSQDTTTTYTVPALLDVDIAAFVTSEQVGAALGTTVGPPSDYDSGTAARYTSADAQSSAEICMQECERGIYDATVALYTDAQAAPNMGEIAAWSAQTKQLLVYSKGYMISVTVDAVGKHNDGLLQAARQLAALVLETLE